MEKLPKLLHNRFEGSKNFHLEIDRRIEDLAENVRSTPYIHTLDKNIEPNELQKCITALNCENEKEFWRAVNNIKHIQDNDVSLPTMEKLPKLLHNRFEGSKNFHLEIDRRIEDLAENVRSTPYIHTLDKNIEPNELQKCITALNCKNEKEFWRAVNNIKHKQDNDVSLPTMEELSKLLHNRSEESKNFHLEIDRRIEALWRT